MSAAARLPAPAPPDAHDARATTVRDLQRIDTRRKVYECALAVFRRDGVAASRIDDIVRLAGVSRGTFYFHFPTKDDVLAELLRASERRIVEELRTLSPGASAITILDAVADAMARQWQDDPRLFAEVAMVGLRRTAADGGVTREPGGLRHELARLLRGVADRGELTDQMPHEVLADFYLANACAAALAWSGNPVAPLDALLRAVSLLFLDGVRGIARPHR